MGDIGPPKKDIVAHMYISIDKLGFVEWRIGGTETRMSGVPIKKQAVKYLEELGFKLQKDFIQWMKEI